MSLRFPELQATKRCLAHPRRGFQLRCSKSVCRFALGLALAVVIFAVPSLSAESRSDDANGEWRGDFVTIRWREAQQTAFRPDTVIVLENGSGRNIAVVFDWAPRRCDGSDVRPTSAGIVFAHNLREAGPGFVLKPQEWNALIFPRGLPPDEHLDTTTACVATIIMQIREGGLVVDRLELTLPAPLTPREHE